MFMPKDHDLFENDAFVNVSLLEENTFQKLAVGLGVFSLMLKVNIGSSLMVAIHTQTPPL